MVELLEEELLVVVELVDTQTPMPQQLLRKC